MWWSEGWRPLRRTVRRKDGRGGSSLLLYTSGTTREAQGNLHTTGGYLVGTYATSKWVFDLKEEDVYWCTADIGWVTGHSYVVYGPLANGATCLMYEGAPDTPSRARFWDLIERHGVTILYTAPTAIRAFMKWGTEWPEKHDLSSLRLLGSVGEPINPEAWIWYQKYIGGGRCPIVDTWWQTETGMILITPLPGITTTRPGSATAAVPWNRSEDPRFRRRRSEGRRGYLAITRPWPAMLRTIWNDDERYVQTYWSKWRNDLYFPGDGAKRDADGYFWLLGRVDDVMNVAGHRIGTMEVESALVDHHACAEAAVVGVRDEIKGTGIAAFVILKEKGATGAAAKGGSGLEKELAAHVARKIGAIGCRTDLFTSDRPKTRSWEIMLRRFGLAEGGSSGHHTPRIRRVASLKNQYDDRIADAPSPLFPTREPPARAALPRGTSGARSEDGTGPSTSFFALGHLPRSAESAVWFCSLAQAFLIETAPRLRGSHLS